MFTSLECHDNEDVANLVISRCADLNRLDAQSSQADAQVKTAAARLRDARASKQSHDDIQAAAQALASARLAATQAHRTAKQQGSGAPGDKPKNPAETGSVIDLYA